jgi:hypothetical protein
MVKRVSVLYSLSRVSSLCLSIFLSLDLNRDLSIYLSPGGVKQ